ALCVGKIALVAKIQYKSVKTYNAVCKTASRYSAKVMQWRRA
ncbi:succinate dehydrogenase flavoprotein subunit, partial [Vibrio parahaemolyticus AQ3810]